MSSYDDAFETRVDTELCGDAYFQRFVADGDIFDAEMDSSDDDDSGRPECGDPVPEDKGKFR